MKNLWSDMISFLPLQEFMSLTYVQGKLHAFAPYSIFYIDSMRFGHFTKFHPNCSSS
ncbi:hypothetical protein BHE74_00025394 [Ensete ventricosum]|nr:hypothetical protein BHE74_00025394 [Ensete ventricosum]RZS12844.1 hypothetical protein BHM03_00044330 [Ensete ventricosum]